MEVAKPAAKAAAPAKPAAKDVISLEDDDDEVSSPAPKPRAAAKAKQVWVEAFRI